MSLKIQNRCPISPEYPENTLGRKTTILQGSEKQGKNLDQVIKKLEEEGFKIKP